MKWQIHHTVPKEILTSKDANYQVSRDFLDYCGLNIESFTNKVALLDGNTGVPNPNNATIHRGSHPDTYTNYINNEMKEIAVGAKELSPNEYLDRVNDFIEKTKDEIFLCIADAPHDG